MLELEQFLGDEHWTLVRWFNKMDASFRKRHALESDSEDEEDAEWYPNGIKPERVDPHATEPTGTISALELKNGLTHLGAGFDSTEVSLIMQVRRRSKRRRQDEEDEAASESCPKQRFAVTHFWPRLLAPPPPLFAHVCGTPPPLCPHMRVTRTRG